MMVRVCVVCHGAAKEGLAVFPFPRCGRQRSAWLAALPSLTRTSVEGWLLESQHGVCEQHFIAQDIRRGSRTTLTRRAVPVRNLHQEVPDSETSQSQALPLSSGAGDAMDESFLRDGRKGSRWQVSGNQGQDSEECMGVDINDYLPQNNTYVKTPESGQENKVIMQAEHRKGTNDHICLVCGRESGNLGLVCALDSSVMSNNVSLSVLVAKIVGRSKREVTCVSISMCSCCQSLVQEVAQIEEELKTKKQDIKEMFEKTLQDQRDKLQDVPDSCKYSRPPDGYTEADCSTDFVTYNSSVTEDKEISDNFLPDKTEDDSRKYSRRQASSKKYSCPQCKEEFSSLALWVHHLSKHSDAEDPASQNRTKTVTPKIKKPRSVSHACKECGKTFTCKQTLLTHTSTHQQGSDCSVCGRYLTTRARLKVHLFRFHGIGEEPDKEVVCQDCGKCFGTKAGLRYHRNVVHHVGPKYSCEHCNKVFHYHVPYRSHMLYSHGEKKIICETCGEKFFTISKLNTHINAVHREAQTWACDSCQIKFTTHTAYRHHVNIKHLQVHHTCDYCRAQFRKRSSLLLHLWKHSVYICHLCRENFTSGESLQTHMSATHGKEMNLKGRRKQNAQQLQNKKLVNTQEVIIQKNPVAEQHIQQNEQVASIVINDLLMTAESYDNTSLPSFSLATCEKLPEKDAFTNDEDIKVKTLSMIDTTQQLPVVDSGPFSTVETLEVKSSDHIEMGSEHMEMGSEHMEMPSEHIKMASDHIEMSPEHIEMTSDHIEMPSEHIEMTSDHIEMPPEHIEMTSDHIEIPPEHIEMTSDHIKMGSNHIEIGSGHIEMGPGVSLILGEMEMPQGSEDTLGSEDMLADAAHHLTMPPLDTHLTEDLEASGPELEAPVHTLETSHALEESSHTLVVSGHAAEAQGHGLEVRDHTLEATSHTLEVSGPVLDAPSNPLDSPSHALEVTDDTLEASSHSLEVNTHPLEVNSHSLEAPSHALEVTDHTLETPGHSLEAQAHTLDSSGHTLEHIETSNEPNQPLPSPSTLSGPLSPTVTQMEEKEGVAEGGEGSGTRLDEKVELQPFSVTLDGKGELKYQYVMYISAPTEDTEPG